MGKVTGRIEAAVIGEDQTRAQAGVWIGGSVRADTRLWRVTAGTNCPRSFQDHSQL